MAAYDILSRRTPRSPWVDRAYFSVGDARGSALHTATKIASSHANLGEHANIIILRGDDPDWVGTAARTLRDKRGNPSQLLESYGQLIEIIEWIGADLTQL